MVKFGEQMLEMRKAEWAAYYVAYTSLKDQLKPLAECLAAAQETAERAAAADAQANQAPPPDGASVDSDAPTVEELRSLAKKAQERAAMMEKVWFDTLQMEVEKVNKHYLKLEKRIAAAITEAKKLRRRLGGRGRGDMSEETQDLRREFMSQTEQLDRDMRDLRQFSQLNYTACFKIMKKFDKVTGLKRMNKVLSTIDRQPFYAKAVAPLPEWDDHVAGMDIFEEMGRDEVMQQIRRAQHCMDEAVMAVRLLLSTQERDDLLHRNKANREAAVKRLTTIVESASAAQVDTVLFVEKLRLFKSMCDSIVAELRDSYPEASAVLHKMFRAHHHLFDVYRHGRWIRLHPSTVLQAAPVVESPTSNLHRMHTDVSNLSVMGDASDSDSDSDSGGESAGRGSSGERDRALSAEGVKLGSVVTDSEIKRAPPPLCSKQGCLQSPWAPPFTKWIAEYNVRENLRPDVIAGITIAIMVVPQGLAYSLLANLPPIYGIYASIVPALVYPLFGSSKHAAVGPMSIPCLLVGAALQRRHSDSEDELVAAATVISFMVGALCMVMGTFRLGFLVRFIANPVLSGFASAAATITIVSVSKDIFRVSVDKTPVIYESLPWLLQALPDTHWPSTAVGFASLFIVIGLKVAGSTKRCAALKKLPEALVCLAVMLLASFLMCQPLAGEDTPHDGAYSCFGVKILGDIPSTLPSPRFPSLAASEWVALAKDSMMITFVAFVESIAVAKMYAMRFGYDVNASQELVALGAANMVGSCFLSFPVMGAFGRSAVNVATGAKSQASLMVSGAVVGLLLLLITPVLYYLPKAVLAAIVITAVAGLVDIAGARKLWIVSRYDLSIMTVSFVATLCLGVELGMLSAMGFSLLVFIYRSTKPRVAEIGRVRGTVEYRAISLLHELEVEELEMMEGGMPVHVDRIPGVRIVQMTGPLFFANAAVLKDYLTQGSQVYDRDGKLTTRRPWRCVILDLSNSSTIDSTALQALNDARMFLASKSVNIRFIVAHANRTIMRKLIDFQYAGEVAPSVHKAVQSFVLGAAAPTLLDAHAHHPGALQSVVSHAATAAAPSTPPRLHGAHHHHSHPRGHASVGAGGGAGAGGAKRGEASAMFAFDEEPSQVSLRLPLRTVTEEAAAIGGAAQGRGSVGAGAPAAGARAAMSALELENKAAT